jgi:hypothetical protein
VSQTIERDEHSADVCAPQHSVRSDISHLIPPRQHLREGNLGTNFQLNSANSHRTDAIQQHGKLPVEQVTSGCVRLKNSTDRDHNNRLMKTQGFVYQITFFSPNFSIHQKFEFKKTSFRIRPPEFPLSGHTSDGEHSVPQPFLKEQVPDNVDRGQTQG